MKGVIRIFLAAILTMASLGVSAQAPDGYWFPDLSLTREKLALADPAGMTKICSNIRQDGFYLLSVLLIVHIDKSTLQMRMLGGGTSQMAHLQSEDSTTGLMYYRSPPAAPAELVAVVAPYSPGVIQVRVPDRESPELNLLYWIPKTNEEVAQMDADLLAGHTGFLSNIATTCP